MLEQNIIIVDAIHHFIKATHSFKTSNSPTNARYIISSRLFLISWPSSSLAKLKNC